MDFKVDNVLISPDDGGCRPVLIDCFEGWVSDDTGEQAVCKSACITSLAMLEPALCAARSCKGRSRLGPAGDLLSHGCSLNAGWGFGWLLSFWL